MAGIIDDIVIDNFGGYVTIEVIRTGDNGPEVIERRVEHNLVVNSGKRQTWRITQGLSSQKWQFMRIGTCGATPISLDTNVRSPITGTIHTVDAKTLLAGTRTAQWVISYPSGASSKSVANIAEAVLLNQRTSPGGSCFMRVAFPTAIDKTTRDKLRITYTVRIV